MSLDMFTDIVTQAEKIAQGINLSFFGEPMLHPEFSRFINCLKKRSSGLKVFLNTNLSLATRDIFNQLIEINLDELRLSIDAASSQTYEIVRPGGNGLNLDGDPNLEDRFDMICEKALYWFSLPNHRPTRHVFTVNSKNRHDIKPFAETWLPRLSEKDHILFKRILSYGGKISDDMISPNLCNAWDLHSLTVDWHGQVSPCNLDTNMDLAIGSIGSATLLELFTSKKKSHVEHLSRKKQIRLCQECIDANNWLSSLLMGKGDPFMEESLEIFSERV